jgi:hypothetical protein
MTGIINQCKQFETFIPSVTRGNKSLLAGHLIAHASDSDYQIYSGLKVLMLFECLSWHFMMSDTGKYIISTTEFKLILSGNWSLCLLSHID